MVKVTNLKSYLVSNENGLNKLDKFAFVISIENDEFSFDFILANLPFQVSCDL